MQVVTGETIRCSVCSSPFEKHRCSRNCNNVYDELRGVKVKCIECGKESSLGVSMTDFGNGSTVCVDCLSKEQSSEDADGAVWECGGSTISPYYLSSYDEECKHVRQGKWLGTRILSGVFVAGNEGGFASTGACLECMKEHAERIGI